MNKFIMTYVLAIIFVIISTTVIFAQGFNTSNKYEDKTIIKYETVKIYEGDCLSLIAEQHNTSNMSNKEFVKYLKNFNNLKSDTIYYGNNILVPIFK